MAFAGQLRRGRPAEAVPVRCTRLRCGPRGGAGALRFDTGCRRRSAHPRESEDVLHRHPDLQDVAVLGIPRETPGDEVAAGVMLRRGAEQRPIAYSLKTAWRCRGACGGSSTSTPRRGHAAGSPSGRSRPLADRCCRARTHQPADHRRPEP
ncbi:hypothetical protein ACFVTP_22875 [Streptomyces celluloflavus]|uniref:AMP-binding enzyme n=1 Tax=Streptomyces celluloflavus TaxID=58344 RepID=UPI0036DE7309